MYLVWIGTALVVVKWLEVGPVQGLSWWWVVAPLAVALVGFECLERLFGRDQRRTEWARFEYRAGDGAARTVKLQDRR
jgi:small Trp-rich protein